MPKINTVYQARAHIACEGLNNLLTCGADARLNLPRSLSGRCYGFYISDYSVLLPAPHGNGALHKLTKVVVQVWIAVLFLKTGIRKQHSCMAACLHGCILHQCYRRFAEHLPSRNSCVIRHQQLLFIIYEITLIALVMGFPSNLITISPVALYLDA